MKDVGNKIEIVRGRNKALENLRTAPSLKKARKKSTHNKQLQTRRQTG